MVYFAIDQEIVLGPDHGDIFVDAELMSEMDGPVEQAMEDQALKRWRETWKAENPGKHATLRVRFRNYFGEDVFNESAKV